jgi:GNAT superfamily N-acetyltransferase
MARRLDVRLWRPGDRLVGPSAFTGSAHLGYLAFHWFGVFASADYCAICLDEVSGKPVHVSSIFPRFFRFPFMGRDDLQIGATFTSPAFRGRGLAHRALVEAVAQLAKPGRSFWYLSEVSNAASCAVAEKAGFELFGHGARFARFGVGALGAYRLIDEEMRVGS